MKTKRVFGLVMALIMLFCCLPLAALAADTTTTETAPTLSSDQLDSVVMLNYLTFLSTEINASSNSRLFLEEAYSTLFENTKNLKDTDTQYYLTNLLNVIETYRMIEVKLQRLEYIYEQNKAQALREAVPNPLGLLSAVQSFSMKKIIASVVYMAVDSVTSYQSASSQADLEYLKDGWALDDEASTNLHNARLQLFNYRNDLARKYTLPDELTLRENDIEDLVRYGNNKNVVSRIQFLEANQETYRAFGYYWLILAKSYYEKENYAKCLEAINEYEKLQIGIFRQDTGFAEVLPLAISSLEEVSPNDRYITEAPRYAALIEKNTRSGDWALRYFAAQTYISLYAKTKDISYLRKAYNIALNNVNELVEVQRGENGLNAVYLADVVEATVPDGATKQEKKDVKQYNKLLKENRKTELPPVYEPLLLNCDLLFALAGQLGISDAEKTKIEGILHPDGTPLFLVEPLDEMYSFQSSGTATSPNIVFDGTTLVIPVQYLSAGYDIKVTVYDDDSTVFSDWKLKKIDRKSGAAIETFTATFTSDSIKKYSYTPTSIVKVEIIPLVNSDCQTITVDFQVTSYKKIAFVTTVSFGKVE